LHISEYLKIKYGHENIDFIDINTSHDTKLFIDPCLIEITNNAFCTRSNKIINDFFENLYALYSRDSSNKEKLALLNYSQEINASKLGYGNGKNGKAKSPEGMIEMLQDLPNILSKHKDINKPSDLPLFYT